MSYSNGIISAPVTIDDVKAALGESSNDLATLCKSKNINMWSKHKPTRWAVPFYETATTIIKNQWWNGIDNDFNISYPSFITNEMTFLDGMNCTVDIKRPNGGSTSSGYPYRLGDFKDYNTAPSWINNGNGMNKLIYTSMNVDNACINGNIYITFYVSHITDNNTINIFEATSIAKELAFFGVELAIKTGTDSNGLGIYEYKTITTNNPFNDTTDKVVELKTSNNYVIGNYSRPINGALSMNINLLSVLFNKYVGKSITIFPIISTNIHIWDTHNGNGSCKCLYVRGENVGAAENTNVVTFNLKSASENTNYHRPTITLELNNVYNSGTSINTNGIAVTLTNKVTNGSKYTSYTVSQINVVLLHYVSNIQQYVYNNDKSFTTSKHITLNYVANSKSTIQITDVDLSIPIVTKSSKYKVVYSVSVTENNTKDIFSTSIEKEI